ncbi:MAG: ABC transporter permease [Gemmatimonadaceae bacterium]
MIRRRFFQHENARDSVPRAVDEELEFHLSTRVDALVAQGWNSEEARREAERQFGNVDGVRGSCIDLDHERVRTNNRMNLLHELAQDFHYAWRLLQRNWAFASAVIIMLSLGIGSNTAIFTFVNAVLLRPLPVANAKRLLAIGDPSQVSSMSRGDPITQLISVPMYRALRTDSVLGPELLASGLAPRLSVRATEGQVDVEHPRARIVSGNYFHVLGVRAALGRTFDAREDGNGSISPVVVLSDAYWTRRFNRDANVVGRTIVINGTGFTVVGVAPEEFFGEIVGQPQDFWLPLATQPILSPAQPLLESADASWLLLLQRVPSGLTLSQAQSSLTTRIRVWIHDHNTDTNAKTSEVVISSGERGFSRTRKEMAAPLAVLMAGVGLLLLLVCANVANLLLARGVARGREMSVRLALGARRGRLVRQLVTESSLLAVGGALGGILVAWGGIRLIIAMEPNAGPSSIDFSLDPIVLLFAAVVAIVSVVFFGLIPALRASQVNLATAMRGTIGWERGRRGVPGIGRIGLNQALVAGQVALSLVLIVSAGLLSRDLRKLETAETGIDQAHLLTVDLDADGAGYHDKRLAVLAETMRRETSSQSGVKSVSYSESGLFSGRSMQVTVSVPGFVTKNGEDINAGFDAVGPNYVKTIGARIIVGRDIDEHDVAESERVVLINESLARVFFAGRTALGATIKNGNSELRIVGVIADIKDNALSAPPMPRFYVPYLQNASSTPRNLIVLVKSTELGDPGKIGPLMRSTVKRVDGSIEVAGIASVAVRMERSLSGERSLMRLALALGGLALLLAAIGLYGVMSYAVSRRTNEIGLRMALGADRSAVLRMVFGDAMRLVLLGVAIGMPACLALTRLLGSQLHGVGAIDPVSLIGAVVVLCASAALAALSPAVRASRVAPMRAIGM